MDKEVVLCFHGTQSLMMIGYDDAVLDADLAVSLGFAMLYASRLNTARVHRRSLMPQHTPSCPCHGCPRRMHASLSPRYSAACHKYRYRMRCIF